MKSIKKIICIALCSVTFIPAACSKPESAKDAFWEDFLAGRADDSALQEGEKSVNKPSYGYSGKTEQGYNGWYYGTYSDGVFSEAAHNGSVWESGGAVLDKKFMTSTQAVSSARKYVNCGSEGKVTICGTLTTNTKSGELSLNIYNGGELIESVASVEDKEGVYYTCETLLPEEGQLYFVLEGNGQAAVEPLIVYDDSKLTLHAENAAGYYGDLIPFYNTDDKKMYMYYMTGDVSDLANPKIDLNLAVSSDLFNYNDVEYEVYPFVDRAVNLNRSRKDKISLCGTPWSEVLDYDTFPEGYRDHYMFFDSQVNRWRYLALCYYSRSGMIKCALGTGISDDEGGKSWSTPVKILKNYPLFKQPECPCAMWINDRWYIFCSLWGESIHNVGRFRYYIGDVGKGIDEQDWLEKQDYYLDGEDLCAAQVVDVGGRYLMYGWIVKCYEDSYFPKVIDNGLWGGAMNLPREVYQCDDGTLGTRIPEEIKSLMKKGVIAKADDVTLNDGSVGLIEKSFGSVYVSFEANIAGAKNTVLTLTSGNKDYNITFSVNDGKTEISVGCRLDSTHPVASYYTVDSELERISVDLIVEGNVIEMFINDRYALSARTSMFSGITDKVTFSSDGKCTVNNFTVNKLANRYNVYD